MHVPCWKRRKGEKNPIYERKREGFNEDERFYLRIFR